MFSIWFQTVFGFRSYHRLMYAGAWRSGFFVLYLWLIGLLVFNFWFGLQMHKRLPVFLRSFPSVTFEQGRLTAPKKRIFVTLPDTAYSLVFDATAKNPPSQQEFLDKHILAFITGNKIYMPSVSGIQVQPLPDNLNTQITPQILQENEPLIIGALQTMVFFASALSLGFFFICSWVLALFTLTLWNALTRAQIPSGCRRRMAAFLQGPAAVLWLVHIWVGVPLFVFGLFILFNIYTQQIFNILPTKTR